jgi:hypothetical protein
MSVRKILAQIVSEIMIETAATDKRDVKKKDRLSRSGEGRLKLGMTF